MPHGIMPGPSAACLGMALAMLAQGRIPWLEEEMMEKFASSQPGLPCREPVRRAPVHFPDHLVVGDAADLSMYSGYVNVTSTDYLFYWLVEAEEGVPEDAPLIVWSNGGPGCSAMEGATTEHGPLVLFDIKENSRLAPPKLTRNPYSWSKAAHVLYVDQPRYVGFSCGTGPFVTTSVDAGRDMVNFLRGWRQLFPEHARRDVILAAESYGGHFIPAWVGAILDYNAEGVADPISVIGLSIGNGIINNSIQDGTFAEFARQQELIPANVSIEQSWGAREIMKNYLGYEPNYYDYRLMEQVCCGCSSYNYKPWTDWLMRKDVNEALNVCGEAGTKAFAGCAAGCIQLPAFDKGDKFDYSGTLARALEKGIRVTLYYGMQDTACNYIGGFTTASSLEWTGKQGFNEAKLEDLMIGGIPTGSVKAHGGLTWIQIEGAGHMVPINNPPAAFYAISTLVPKGPRLEEDSIPHRSVFEHPTVDFNLDAGKDRISKKFPRDGPPGVDPGGEDRSTYTSALPWSLTLSVVGLALLMAGLSSERFFVRRHWSTAAYLLAPARAQGAVREMTCESDCNEDA